MKKNALILFILLTVFLQACKKVEGVGGDASIHGKVYFKHYNSTFTTLLNEGDYPDTYVYIIYGNNINYGQRIKTNYKGEFEFKHLYKGNYQIYTYSVDSAALVNGVISPPPKAVVSEVSIHKRKEIIDIGMISVYN